MSSELPGFSYLYELATLAMGLLTFTLVYIFIRQAEAHKLTDFDIYTTRAFVKTSIILIVASLLPGALYNLTYNAAITWCISSAAATAMLAENAIMFLRGRRRVTSANLGWRVNLVLCSNAIAIAILAINTVVRPVTEGSGLFVAGVTVSFFATLLAILGRFDPAYDARYHSGSRDSNPRPSDP